MGDPSIRESFIQWVPICFLPSSGLTRGGPAVSTGLVPNRRDGQRREDHGKGWIHPGRTRDRDGAPERMPRTPRDGEVFLGGNFFFFLLIGHRKLKESLEDESDEEEDSDEEEEAEESEGFEEIDKGPPYSGKD